eukprot:scaffold4537_cov144-Isochrysis_galbana.AAC.2
MCPLPKSFRATRSTFHSVETWSHSFVHGPYRALASLVALGVLSPPTSDVIEPGPVGAQIEAQC